MQLGTALNLPNPRINFGGTGRAPGKGNTAIFSFETGVLDSRINFSRTTNATVTNSAGLITYAPHNLLTYSEQFDNAAWTKTTTTVSANAIASPVSTTTGDTLTAGGANSTTLHSYTAIAQPYTFSIYIRRRTGTGTIEITADGSTYVAKTITSDWARYDTTITPTAGTRTPGVRIVTSGDAIDVWGAQLEIGSTATTYNSTTVKNLLGYSELFDNAAWAKSNSFVQTNSLTFSEAFDNAAWGKTRSNITGNAEIAPNGYQTADKFYLDNSAATTHSITQSFAFSAGQYTYSVYVKPAGLNYINLYSFAVTAGCYFNVSNGTVIGAGAGITGAITPAANGYYRCSITFTSTASTFGNTLFLSANGTDIIPNGDGVSGVYIWGAQLVQGTDAGAYRRTDSAALPVFYPNHNGVVCAEQFHASAANGTALESYTATGGSMTFSVWMRRITGTGNVDLTMDTGVTYTTQAITTSWARYSITTTPTAGARTAGIRLVTSGDVIQMFGAQVSDSASLDPYVLNAAAAPTAAAYYGARFDYDPVTLEAKGLLIEEQRQNLLLNSTIAGTNLATQNVTVTAVAHTLSFYGTGSITLSGTASATLTGTGAYPTRSTLTFTPTAGTLTLTVSGTVQFAQLEIGSFATSFIPTAASQTTRAADVATIQGSNFYSWYNQNEGTLFANFLTEYSGNADTARYIMSLDNSTSKRVLYVGSGGETLSNFDGSSIITANTDVTNVQTKAATSYTPSNRYITANNIAVTSGNVVGTYSYSSSLNISSPVALCGWIKSISYYPQKLSDSVLKGLTA